MPLIFDPENPDGHVGYAAAPFSQSDDRDRLGGNLMGLMGNGGSRADITGAQARIDDMLQGWDDDGGTISNGGVLSFVEDVFSTLSKRMPRIPHVIEQGEPRRLTHEDPEYGVMLAFARMFRSESQAPDGLAARRLLYRRSFGEYWVVWHSQPIRFEILPPMSVRVDKGWVSYDLGEGFTNRVPVSQAVRVVNDIHKPGVPHSKWFPVLDHLDRIDQAFASIDRPLLSRLYNTKLISVTRQGDANSGGGPSWSPSIPSTHQAPTPGQPAQGVPMPGAETNPVDKIGSDLKRLGSQRIDRRHRRKASLAAPLTVSGPWELDVIDPIVGIDPEVFQVIETDVQIVARATTLPTNFVMSGYGESNHWSAYLTRDEVLDNSVLPEIHEDDRQFMQLVGIPILRRLNIVPNPERYLLLADDTPVRNDAVSTDDLAVAYRFFAIDRVGLAESMNIPPDRIPELPDGVTEYDHWAGNVGPFADTALHAPEKLSSQRQVAEPAQAAAALEPPQVDWDDELDDLLRGGV